MAESHLRSLRHASFTMKGIVGGEMSAWIFTGCCNSGWLVWNAFLRQVGYTTAETTGERQKSRCYPPLFLPRVCPRPVRRRSGINQDSLPSPTHRICREGPHSQHGPLHAFSGGFLQLQNNLITLGSDNQEERKENVVYRVIGSGLKGLYAESQLSIWVIVSSCTALNIDLDGESGLTGWILLMRLENILTFEAGQELFTCQIMGSMCWAWIKKLKILKLKSSLDLETPKSSLMN